MTSGDWKYLSRRGKKGTIYLRVPMRPGDVPVRISLGVNDEKMARKVRDRVVPTLKVEMSVAAIAIRILQELKDAHVEIERVVQIAAPEYAPVLEKSIEYEELIKLFIENRVRINNIKSASANTYATTIRQFFQWCPVKNIKEITATHIDNFTMFLKKDGRIRRSTTVNNTRSYPMKDRSVSNKYKLLSTFFDWATRKDHVIKNPMLKSDAPKYKKNPTPSPPFELLDKLCSIPRPEGCPVSQETWEALPYILRYTSCRIGEAVPITGDRIKEIDGILCVGFDAEKDDKRVYNPFPDGIKWLPVHPKLKSTVLHLKALRGNGHLLIDAGYAKISCKDLEDAEDDARYGNEFRRAWVPLAKQIWEKMKIHGFRAYCAEFFKNSDVRKEIAQEVLGHAAGDVHDLYAKRARIPTLYEAICKLP